MRGISVLGNRGALSTEDHDYFGGPQSASYHGEHRYGFFFFLIGKTHVYLCTTWGPFWGPEEF